MAKVGYYAVRNGTRPGVYSTWDECSQQIKGFPKAIYKKFPTQAQADAFVQASISDGYGPPKSNKRPLANDPGQVSHDSLNNLSAPSNTRSFSTSSSLPATPKRPRPASESPPPSTSTYASTSKLPAKSKAKKAKLSSGLQPTRVGEDGYTRLMSGRIVVFTDGSGLGNGKTGCTAGAGVFWGDSHPSNAAIRVPGSLQTNNRGELLAIAIALERAPIDNCPLEVRSDSQYSIKCLTEWLPNWRRNKFRNSTGKEVLNKDLIIHIATLLDIRRSAERSSVDTSRPPAHSFDDISDSEGTSSKGKMSTPDWEWDGNHSKGAVRFQWVKAHEGTHGNEMADALANEGARLPVSPLKYPYLTLLDFTACSKRSYPMSLANVNLSFTTTPATLPQASASSRPPKARADKHDSSHSEIDDDLSDAEVEVVASHLSGMAKRRAAMGLGGTKGS